MRIFAMGIGITLALRRLGGCGVRARLWLLTKCASVSSVISVGYESLSAFCASLETECRLQVDSLFIRNRDTMARIASGRSSHFSARLIPMLPEGRILT